MPDGQVIRPTAEGNPGDGRIAAEKLDSALKTLLGVWTADTRFILNQVSRMNERDALGKFTGRIDINSVGVAGHSFGGATAVQFCHDDRRCRSGINIRGVIWQCAD